ncbi:MAG: hypothetical protein AAGI66_04900 [Cyanobacteria bacterium P01_H01_bin.74]
MPDSPEELVNSKNKPETPKKKSRSSAQWQLSDWKPLGALNDYFTEQMRQDKQW